MAALDTASAAASGGLRSRQIVISAAYGSLGDLQPMLGLALELQKNKRNKARLVAGSSDSSQT